MAKSKPAFGAPRIVVSKAERRLELFDGPELVASYRVALGFTPVGDKERRDDGRTPEGEFFVFVKNSKSKYHLSLGLGYPDAEDAARGLAAGLISEAEHAEIVAAGRDRRKPPQETPLGGEIYIHGGGTDRDWTRGCVALEDGEMSEIYEAARIGMPVLILP